MDQKSCMLKKIAFGLIGVGILVLLCSLFWLMGTGAVCTKIVNEKEVTLMTIPLYSLVFGGLKVTDSSLGVPVTYDLEGGLSYYHLIVFIAIFAEIILMGLLSKTKIKYFAFLPIILAFALPILSNFVLGTGTEVKTLEGINIAFKDFFYETNRDGWSFTPDAFYGFTIMFQIGSVLLGFGYYYLFPKRIKKDKKTE